MSAWIDTLVVAWALVLSVGGGWVVTGLVLRLASRSRDAGAAGDDGGPTGAVPRAALRGGTWIGLLERLTITAAMLAGYPAAIAFVIAVKGLGRYPELREHPTASERFVIGTLASMGWAAIIGIGGLALMGGAVVGE